MQFGIGYVFQLWLMGLYKERDAYDWLIRMSIVPEFIYANILTLVLVGSYFFLFFNTLTERIRRRGSIVAQQIIGVTEVVFRACGYTEGWGTRTQ